MPEPNCVIVSLAWRWCSGERTYYRNESSSELLCKVFLSSPETVIKSNKITIKINWIAYCGGGRWHRNENDAKKSTFSVQKNLPSSTVNAPSFRGFIELYLPIRSNFVFFFFLLLFLSSLSHGLIKLHYQSVLGFYRLFWLPFYYP